MKDYILIFSAHVNNWGAERSTCSLCEHLKSQGYNVLVIIPRIGEITELLDNIKVEYLIFPFDLWWGSRKWKFHHLIKLYIRQKIRVHRLNQIFNMKKIHPVLAYSSTVTFGFGIMVAKSLQLTHIQHIRENIDAFGNIFLFGYDNTMNYINKNSSAVICTSELLKARYASDIDASKLYSIYNGIPNIDMIPAKKHSGKLRLVQVGRFMNDKRIFDSIESIRLLAEKGCRNLSLDIFGKGEEESAYRNLITNYHLEDVISIKGYCDNIDYSQYDVGLMTSTFEAFGRATVEYMNYGLAVIASDSGANPEIVKDGITGLLYKVHEPQALADAILKLYENMNMAKAMGQAGKARFIENFTQEQYVTRVGNLITSFISH